MHFPTTIFDSILRYRDRSRSRTRGRTEAENAGVQTRIHRSTGTQGPDLRSVAERLSHTRLCSTSADSCCRASAGVVATLRREHVRVDPSPSSTSKPTLILLSLHLRQNEWMVPIDWPIEKPAETSPPASLFARKSPTGDEQNKRATIAGHNLEESNSCPVRRLR
jgi:hypothetical protein